MGCLPIKGLLKPHQKDAKAGIGRGRSLYFATVFGLSMVPEVGEGSPSSAEWLGTASRNWGSLNVIFGLIFVMCFPASDAAEMSPSDNLRFSGFGQCASDRMSLQEEYGPVL